MTSIFFSSFGADFLADLIVSFIKSQYRSIDLLASSFPGIGKSIPSGFELLSKIAIIGKGNIGWAIKQLLKNDYEIKHGDITEGLDARDIDQVRSFLDGMDAVISAGPFAINKNIGTIAAEMGIGYFDLTEDVETTEFIRSIDSNSVMMPQCGLAPGAINICAAGMINQFDKVTTTRRNKLTE